jgi:23S rRNA pseudouridine1911/1915/1917 synthase
MAVCHWQVTPEEAGKRLDVYLTQKVAGLSRSAAGRAVRNQEVEVSGQKQLKTGLILKPGQQVFYQPPQPRAAAAAPQDLPLVIVYEDADLAVIDKPAGLVTHPAPGHPSRTLVNALLYHLHDLSGLGGQLRPGIVHRLDKETSGLLVVAKHDLAHQALAASLQARGIKRSYAALVWGNIYENTFTINTLLGRDPHDRKRFAVVRIGGKQAITHGQVQERLGEFSLLRLDLETGRTHQIRVHCLYAGIPVVGDRVYGKRGEAGQLHKLGLARPARQLLHAAHLSFNHPLTGQPLEFNSPWPEDFQSFYTALKEQYGR